MRKLPLCALPVLFLGCLPGINDVLSDLGRKPVPHKPEPRPGPDAGPFAPDSGTVFLGDFDQNTLNRVTGKSGTLFSGGFAPARFGSGVRPAAAGNGKYYVDYPNTPDFSLRNGIEGSLEALVWYDGLQPGFAHIVEKAWQYAISAHDGRLAADFGTDWWYSDVALPIGRWSYVAATYDGATLKLYLNGEPVASAPYPGYRSARYSNGYDLAIGNSSSDEYDIPFQGTVDAARVSRVVRTPAEIAAVWKGIAKRLP
jgi:hypothetical protein